MILGRLGKGYCKKNRVLEFLVEIFGVKTTLIFKLLQQKLQKLLILCLTSVEIWPIEGDL